VDFKLEDFKFQMRPKADPSTALGMTAFEGAKAKGRADGGPAVRTEKAKANVDYAGRGPFIFQGKPVVRKASDCGAELEFEVGERREGAQARVPVPLKVEGCATEGEMRMREFQI
jgi:hypothetical protein